MYCEQTVLVGILDAKPKRSHHIHINRWVHIQFPTSSLRQLRQLKEVLLIGWFHKLNISTQIGEIDGT